MKIAVGFNPQYYKYKFDHRVQLVELGIAEYLNIKRISNNIRVPLSLHLSRSPITENKNSQNYYLKQLESMLDFRDFISIGFHLNGGRFSGIGQFGFSSHYYPSATKEKRAINFLKNVQERFNLPTWVENSNFYSSDFDQIKKSYKSTNLISKLSNSKMIIDLSHIVIDFSNAKLHPELCMGLINWENVIELHLSGIIRGKNGIYHDNHSRNVSALSWQLLKKIIPLLGREIYINLEHTHMKIKKVSKEIDKLENILASYPEMPTQHDPLNYVISHYCKLLPRWIPALAQTDKPSLTLMVSAWLRFCKKKSKKLVLNNFEILFSNRISVLYAAEHFIKFSRGELK